MIKAEEIFIENVLIKAALEKYHRDDLSCSLESYGSITKMRCEQDRIYQRYLEKKKKKRLREDIFELDSLSNAITAETGEAAYIQGVLDGYKFLKDYQLIVEGKKERCSKVCEL